jgi:hypothetical protein
MHERAGFRIEAGTALQPALRTRNNEHPQWALLRDDRLGQLLGFLIQLQRVVHSHDLSKITGV